MVQCTTIRTIKCLYPENGKDRKMKCIEGVQRTMRIIMKQCREVNNEDDQASGELEIEEIEDDTPNQLTPQA